MGKESESDVFKTEILFWPATEQVYDSLVSVVGDDDDFRVTVCDQVDQILEAIAATTQAVGIESLRQ